MDTENGWWVSGAGGGERAISVCGDRASGLQDDCVLGADGGDSCARM